MTSASGEAFRVAGAVAHLPPGIVEIGDLLGAGALGGIFGGCRLDGAAGFENAAEQVEVLDIGTHPFKHVSVEDIPVVLIADGGSDAWLATDKAFGFQHFQRFANDGAADAVELAEIVFAGQRRARGIAVRTDILSDRRRDVAAYARAALDAAAFGPALSLDCFQLTSPLCLAC
ncbi:hypothetical protein ACVIKP_004538 [Rhizobium leguminosarum]